MSAPDYKRRQLLQGLGAGIVLPAMGIAPAIIAAPRARPQMVDGVQSGDVTGERALIWSRCDRPARLIVEWDTQSRFGNPRRVISPLTDASVDFTARVDLQGLPADQSIFYRARFEDAGSGVLGESWLGHLRSAPKQPRDIRFVWGGDTCGQGRVCFPFHREPRCCVKWRQARRGTQVMALPCQVPQRRMAPFDAQPFGPGLFLRDAALLVAYLE